ncbi:MAG: NCS2 family permease [Peptococcaceae bacterium]|nr:NCS2 family permease [Peptococcaceae bacterium]
MLAGLTTFLTMAYIIAVNPSILSEAGMDAGAIVSATCLSAAIGCFLMGFLANLPFGLASGMGLNAFFTYSVVLAYDIPWQIALTAVFCEGVVFILLTACKVREAVVNSIPTNMKYAVTGGIGLFIAFIGLINGGLVTADPSTMVVLNDFALPAVITCIGVIIIAALDKRGTRGAILIGIALCSAIAWIYALINPAAAADMGIYLPEGLVKYESIAPIAGKIDFGYLLHPEQLSNFIVILLTFLFVDFFDTVGTLVGVCSKANMLDEDGNVPNASRALMADAIATTTGAALGVSTVTTYVESSTGVSVGGRTGYTAVTVGVLFLVAMFFSPVFVAIPSCATAAALIYVGYLMLSAVKSIDFGNITEGLPAFVTILAMPLTYSIGDGLTLGVLSYVFVNLLYNAVAPADKRHKVSAVMIGLAVVFILKLIFI